MQRAGGTMVPDRKINNPVRNQRGKQVVERMPVHPRSHALNVASQEQDATSLLRCYRALLALRRGHPALQMGSLEWIEAPSLPEDVVAYRRVLGEGDDRERVEVYLNLSKREVSLDLGARVGETLFSTRSGVSVAAPSRYALAAWEAVVIAR